MATKKTVTLLLEAWLAFSPKVKSQAETETLSRTYYEAFRGYSDKQINEAGEKYNGEGEFFPPKPWQITNLIKNFNEDKHVKEMVAEYTCRLCNQKVSAISEGACLDCLGYPSVEYEKLKPFPIEERIPYRIEGRMKCQVCGSIGACIKEPIDEGQWQCQQCYTGLTKKEISQRLRDLQHMTFDKTFKPEWVKPLDDIPF